ncbi:response regulator transcription factor [uncultured Vagococcus sp.]|uniref:response regulator transcription factor n=1 Tax=uncultured Vagococcus sp. TaxID=189676 RepID=UPI0028D0DE05|nr:response regulator transcription factor [uncultured Vagococcus sp.]
MTAILIVEDDAYINDLIEEALTMESYECVQAFSGTEALLLLEKKTVQLIILDLMLPGKRGEDLIPLILCQTEAPIIVLSAIDELASKVKVLTSGAADYMTKPFDIQELVARTKVQLRSKEPIDERLQFETLALDKNTNSLMVSGIPILLTPQEFRIIELLMRYPTKIFSKQDIYEYAWNEFYLGEDKTVNVHISNIRQKIKKQGNETWIKTVWGVGFTLKN